MDTLHHLPLAEIDPHALLRDRSALDPAALDALKLSIATEGLRLPIEVWQLSTPRDGFTHGLISGLRRLTACRDLGHQTIPVLLRTPASIAQAMASMVSENELREPVSPWEKGTLILAAIDEGHFDTPDTAIAALYPIANRMMRMRIRNYATVVHGLEGRLTTPETLSQRQMETLAAALNGGHEDLLIATLMPLRKASLETQWTALRPIFQDLASEPTDPKTGRPRRMLHLRQGLTIRREPTPTGWVLRFSGPEAKKGGLVDDVLDHVEQWFQKE
ncbi:ParB/RepB/Spo0J family partition protein [Tabrizicola sp.]|uniref:ParB/RepB/Spo0J family partition protein n=1 Tax=Tabrizicola sp. TaxID=2005166 RepID=UPI003F3E5B29